jgi:hypothetical protein
VLYVYSDDDLVRLRPARGYLEAVLPLLRKPVLDIGRKAYTAHFGDLVGCEYVSVDRVGRRKPDIMADVLEKDFVPLAKSHFPAYGSVLFNGMIGFGIDTEEQMRKAFEQFHTLLGLGGMLLVGWNETFIHRAKLERILSERFTPTGSIVEPTQNPEKHYFWWWRKDR